MTHTIGKPGRALAGPCLILALALAGCQTGPGAGPNSLYQQLGKRAGIRALTERFLLVIATDPKVEPYFVDTDIVRLHRLLTEQFCVLSGGPCRYTGRDMADTHAGMHVTNTAFNAVVADLIVAMDERGIPLAAQNHLLARLAPMRRDIVNVPQPETSTAGDALGVPRPDRYSAKPLNPGL